MAKKKSTKKKKDKESGEDEWTEDLVEDEDLSVEELDVSKLKFTKIKDMEVGMEEVNIEATIDFVGESRGRGYGEDSFALGFLKDDTGEIKITFWGEDISKAKPGKKVRVLQASIGEFREQLQVYPDKSRGIEFI